MQLNRGDFASLLVAAAASRPKIARTPAAPAPQFSGAPTAVAAFLGPAKSGPIDRPVHCTSFVDYEREFGKYDDRVLLAKAVNDFFANGGTEAYVGRLGMPNDLGSKERHSGLYLLDQVPNFNLLYTTEDDGTRTSTTLTLPRKSFLRAAADYCLTRRAMLLLDAPQAWLAQVSTTGAIDAGSDLFGDPRLNGQSAIFANSAVYLPHVMFTSAAGQSVSVSACGAIAGVFARTDAARGVWKAPAGRDATLNGFTAPEIGMSELQSRTFARLGINPLRAIGPSTATVVWGARTLAGADAANSQWKYIPVRRMAIFLEESILAGTGYATSEPSAAPLWAKIHGSIDGFMQNLFRQGAFAGPIPSRAYFVRCDGSTTSVADVAAGVARVLIGFAPLKPSQFIVMQLAIPTAPPK